MVSRTSASVIYHMAPPRVGMILNEGAWTDNDAYKLGGYFASPLDKDVFVTLDSTDMTVKKATASSDTLIGKLISEPQGEHKSNGRQGTVMLFGTHVMEVELHTSSPAIAVGESVQFSSSGGYYGEGVWIKDGTPNTTVALAAYTSASATGSSIPVLFGKVSF